mmetsp:Transcript_26136/g.61383  ORF Transcript_26136/g.61383 Transcript_26136/m.61383 type:complete len:135 (+) Transcript_26136:158-562(+)|eukprot:CAMPEP_0197172952 /NCGR_PEP_ID=MMETSP1423-20130617/34_1 /TAXON_ID=476441 /ORGANISM="Pseudo-nitzschia heimii, Strain UNC1101" /LENGTH=134 /DNA_ID=CAMNT_0042621677 /DNA_START=152 /DNA_END=556 /DNA_ORIENTATION=+
MVDQRSLAFSFAFVVMHIIGASALSPASSRRSFLSQVEVTLGIGLIAGSTPSIAEAYERRDVGADGSRSADTYAFNEQAFKTNNRLEAQGFQLDTREQEKAKINAAMASFSYESATSSKKKPRNTNTSIQSKTK